MTIQQLRHTSDNKAAGAIRLMLAVMFLMTGPMKLLVPELGHAFAGQLIAAGIPFLNLSRILVPYLEIILGIILVVGFFTRPATVLVVAIMAVATYVHVVVVDPNLFPLQPTAPIIPILVLAMCAFVLKAGAGSWSLDLKASQNQ